MGGGTVQAMRMSSKGVGVLQEPTPLLPRSRNSKEGEQTDRSVQTTMETCKSFTTIVLVR